MGLQASTRGVGRPSHTYWPFLCLKPPFVARLHLKPRGTPGPKSRREVCGRYDRAVAAKSQPLLLFPRPDQPTKARPQGAPPVGPRGGSGTLGVPFSKLPRRPALFKPVYGPTPSRGEFVPADQDQHFGSARHVVRQSPSDPCVLHLRRPRPRSSGPRGFLDLHAVIKHRTWIRVTYQPARLAHQPSRRGNWASKTIGSRFPHSG